MRLAFAAVLAVSLACDRRPMPVAVPSAPIATRVASLHAFARLYGAVRWFHPSDSAASIDWDRFAIDGATRVLEATDQTSLRARLTELFYPIAPTVHIVGPGEEFPADSALHPISTAGLDIIFWQHKGYGDTTVPTDYSSKRRHRDLIVAVRGALSASVAQSVDAMPYRGKRVRLRGKLRTANHGRGQLWLRVDRGDQSGFSDNMVRRPVRSDLWATGEIQGSVAADATRIAFGALNSSPGTVWYDDLELSVEAMNGTWTPIEIKTGGFETTDLLADWHLGTGKQAQDRIEGWNLTIDHDRPASGAASLRIEHAMRVMTQELFEPAPAPGETVDVDLGAGLRARVPIALYSKDGHTIGDDPEVARRGQPPRPVATSASFDASSNAADIIVFWAVFEHFWPYWDTVSVDWNAMLDTALAASFADRSVDDHVATLERLSAAAPDGHVSLSCPGQTDDAYPPFAVDFVESQIVVTASTNAQLERGDVLLSIDGRSAAEVLEAHQALISGSSGWRLSRALQRFGRGQAGQPIAVRIRRGKAELESSVSRVDSRVSEPPSHAAIEALDGGIYYVDLSRAVAKDIAVVIDRLAAAPGVVFDIRDYPNLNSPLLSHLLVQVKPLSGWELVPEIIRPDSGSTPAAWDDTSSWNMPVLSVQQPHIGGRVAFLIGPRAISYAESFLALVEHYHLGELVGATTAGTNGDIAQILLPSGCKTLFTGRKVTKPDGSRHHLVGVQPTVPVSRTIQGVVTGRDEVLERALVYVRGAAQ